MPQQVMIDHIRVVCPECSDVDVRVRETLKVAERFVIRRLVCKKCGARFRTIEEME